MHPVMVLVTVDAWVTVAVVWVMVFVVVLHFEMVLVVVLGILRYVEQYADTEEICFPWAHFLFTDEQR